MICTLTLMIRRRQSTSMVSTCRSPITLFHTTRPQLMQRFRRSYTLVGALGPNPPAASISTDDVRACAERGRRIYELPNESTLPRIVNRDTNMGKPGKGWRRNDSLVSKSQHP
ncbi:hypothetical protein PISMIDRAFT_173005 [Pisolithus microcarpus 441]|uniref:Uncharacterized protein n=1 Tax=Pisolithus microcarpus 441 TaxID=765257 RepID=A0A0C9ZG16_9AGAM|nr:hypothetical protein PISMIDRAFT_467291 [Pisolithus microcarpus 441]KIK18888.1 hypothetical protein PISMIDRAFT_173005 [Pisolithus microcarpus 441]